MDTRLSLPWYRDLTTAHFAERTKGERMGRLEGFQDAPGLTDDRYSVYSGRVYPRESLGRGVEIPSPYFETFAAPMEEQVLLWSLALFRETLLLVLRALVI